MNFDKYEDKIKELLIFKASNNKDREAIIETRELERNIRPTADMNKEFFNYIINLDIVEKAKLIGNGQVQCTVVMLDSEE